MLGTRGIWQNGWKAAALHAPISGAGHFDKDRWELYHVDVDRSESKDLAKENPDKLQALIKVWNDEAEKNMVLPLDDRSALEILGTERPSDEPARERYIYYPETAPVLNRFTTLATSLPRSSWGKLARRVHAASSSARAGQPSAAPCGGLQKKGPKLCERKAPSPATA